MRNEKPKVVSNSPSLRGLPLNDDCHGIASDRIRSRRLEPVCSRCCRGGVHHITSCVGGLAGELSACNRHERIAVSICALHCERHALAWG